MASGDFLTLFTTPIHSTIKGSISTFNGNYGCCKVINFIHSRTMNHQLFQRSGAQHVKLLSYTKAHWLSKGKCLSWFYELKNEVEIFFKKTQTTFMSKFTMKFVVMLAYLADLFGHLNDTNLSLQDYDVTVSDVRDKLAEITDHMGVWQAHIKVESTTSFPLLERRLKMKWIDMQDNIKTCITEDVEIVSAKILFYFKNHTLHVSWYKDWSTLKLTPMSKKQKSWQSSKL